MCVRAVARGAMVAITAAFLSVSAQANEAAHQMAEKFAGEAKGADAKPKTTETASTEANKSAAQPADVTAKRETEHKAEAARKEAARKKAEVARRAAEAKRRAAAKAAEAARAAERRREEETDMLARARLEAEEMRAAAEEARLTEEARRLIIEAERERTKAEELLAGLADAPRPAPAATEPQHAGSGEAERLPVERAEETRRLAEKLKRVRQIHETRIANQAGREAEVGSADSGKPLQDPAPPPAPQEAAVSAAASAPAATPAQVQPPVQPPAQPPVQPPVQPRSQPPVATREAIATAQPGPPPSPARGVTPSPPLDKPDEAVSGERTPHVVTAPPNPATLPAKPTEKTPSVGTALSRATVLLVMVPGSYGIRRGGAQVADPVLCMRDGCYISAGADRPATFLPGRKALGFRNTWGARAGACRNALGCVFRSVELGTLPTFLQPVDLHIFRHDLRAGFAVLADSDCAIAAGRLTCRHGIDAESYTMWIVPERLAETLGPAGLERALSEGLNGPRSARFAPR
jgi:hypothetical protein